MVFNEHAWPKKTSKNPNVSREELIDGLENNLKVVFEMHFFTTFKSFLSLY